MVLAFARKKKSLLMNIRSSGKITFSSDISWSYLKQEDDLDANSTLLDTLYVGNAPAIVALRNYESVIFKGLEGEQEF